jgi:uncharacterized membrane protein YiaA
MTADQRLYATLVRLYPRGFQHDFADDMVIAFGELVEHNGRAATWRRVLVDLAVTVPTYRLETVMAPRRSTNALVALAVTLVLGAVATFAIGVWPVAAILLLAAVVIGITERSHLARSVRPENQSHRRRLLARSAVLGLTAVAVLVIGLFDLGDESHWPADRLLLYNTLFLGAVVAALAHLVVALRHPDDTSKVTAAAGPA